MKELKQKWNDSFKDGRDYSPLNEVLLSKILGKVGDTEGLSVIDLGCGTGDTVIKLAQRGMEAIGFDWSSAAIEKAQIRVKEEVMLGTATFFEGDIDNIEKNKEISGQKFDLAFCKLVFAFVQDKHKFLIDVKNILKSEGTFVLMTPVLHKGYTYIPEDKPGIAVKYDETVEMINGIFSSVEVLDHSYYGERGDLVTFMVHK